MFYARCAPARAVSIGIAFLAAFTAPSAVAQTPRYTIVDLHKFGANASEAWSISRDGAVVGDFQAFARGRQSAFRWSDGQRIEYPLPLGTISAQGHVAGMGGMALITARLPQVVGRTNLPRSFLIAINGDYQELPPLAGDNASQAVGVNTQGVAVGVSTLFIGGPYDPLKTETRAVMWVDGRPIEVFPSRPGQVSWANDISEDGAILGASRDPAGVTHAWILAGGSLTPLASPKGASSYSPIAINRYRAVVGTALDAATFTFRAMADFGAGPFDLGDLGGNNAAAFDINDRGQIVGVALQADGSPRGFLVENGQMVDLTSYISPDSGWIIESANSVNDNGWIVGAGRRLDNPVIRRAILLKPIQRNALQPACVADRTGDHVVNASDLLAVLAGWGNAFAANDLLMVLQQWGATCDTPTSTGGILSKQE